jgi:hypothetical protein
MSMRKNLRTLAALALSLALTTAASAQQPEHGHGAHGAPGHPEHRDVRYSHNHYYAAHGVVVPSVPGRTVISLHGGATTIIPAACGTRRTVRGTWSWARPW